MKFLIVGAPGSVRQAVYRYLQKDGHEVVGTKSKSTMPGLITFDLLKHRILDCVTDSFSPRMNQLYSSLWHRPVWGRPVPQRATVQP